MHVLVLRLRHDPQRREEGQDADGDVDEEDPAPRERLSERAAEHESDGRTANGDRGPDTECPGALLPLGEGGGDDRERRGRDQRGAQPLQRPEADQLAGGGCDPVEQRGAGEDDQADEEEPLPSQEVPRAPAEQQEAGEDERVRVDHPLQAGLVLEAERRLDVRQGNVHDRRVEDDHELRKADDYEYDPGIRRMAAHSAPYVSGLISPFQATSGRFSYAT